MTKIANGKLFEEPTVCIGCPDFRVGGTLLDGYANALKLHHLYGACIMQGRWDGQSEHSVLIPLKLFTELVNGSNPVNGMCLLKHLSHEECIAVFYRHPRNPNNLLMVAFRPAPKLFASVWAFHMNEHTDQIVHTEPFYGQPSGLLYPEGSIMYGKSPASVI